ncbi:hypothetical protein QA641_23975 [Bradyrhizobium sp. CB1650]|uniref:hypothetical protein n=1 Tax=Bradyrhizobium sp. CB1650 TaxID=3039153 RepID=UPI002435F0B2|nr:hypothetical protein [Bradyrhizobium sp. CB1650]WGD48707.1 hypothetical protein QA641_23975 [Bradyrhizobium sp. CB1650]
MTSNVRDTTLAVIAGAKSRSRASLNPWRLFFAHRDFCAIFQGIGADLAAQNSRKIIEPLKVAADILVLGISAPNA